jgi:outer membrane immunogenic protein
VCPFQHSFPPNGRVFVDPLTSAAPPNKLLQMNPTRHLLVTTAVGLLLLPRASAAADLITKAPARVSAPIYSWTGPYVGAHLGWGRGAGSGVNCSFDPLNDSPCDAGTPSLKPDGVLGGVQVGYNWQAGSWLFGLEADISAMDVSDVAHFATTDPNYANAELGSRFDWLGTARARGGFVVDRSLFYATGGLAYARVAQHYFDTPHGTSSASGVKFGWTVGGGYEYAFARNWSVKAEYLYVNLDNSHVDLVLSTGPAVVTRFTFPNDLHIARVGLNYRF